MIIENYTHEQLEEIADELNMKFDPERLIKPKPIDVYAVIEDCLGVPYDWKYITPDQSVLGLTTFQDGYIWVWPKPYYEKGMKPRKLNIDAGTIVIDSTLTEGSNRGRENFTVIHEVFHQILHKNCGVFGNLNYTYTSYTGKRARNQPMTPLEICEYQSNTCTAAFLMPRKPVTQCLKNYTNGSTYISVFDRSYEFIIANMAEKFSVSKKAMRIRLNVLKLSD